jgi:three-Cys-motif partner protein
VHGASTAFMSLAVKLRLWRAIGLHGYAVRASIPTNGDQPMGVLWPLEPHTEAKHRLYKRYLDAWWPIFLQQSWVSRVTYVDAFAGPGQYEAGESGSPVIALERLLNHEARDRMNITRDRVRLIFIEGDRARCEHLNALLVARFGSLDELPIKVIIKHGRAELDTLPLLTATGAWGNPILAIFDSWGNVGVPWGHVQAIASNPSSEVIVTFGPNWFSRRESEEPQRLDEVFGGPQHWAASDTSLLPRHRWRGWLETYRTAILRAGFAYCLPFQVVPRTGQPLDLVFGTSHPRAVEAFKDAMWNVDKSDGMRFSDPRTTVAKQTAMATIQPSLFEDPDAPDAELLGFVVDSLEAGPKTMEQIRDYLLRETARWLPKHAREAIQYLLSEGRLAREPASGRLTKESLLRLAP